LLDTVGLAVGGSLMAAVTLPWLPLPDPASPMWLGISVFIHIAYFLALIEAYRHADLSVAYPLMRGFAPVLVALAAPLFGEPYSLGLMLGVGLVCLGIVLPALLGLRRGLIAKTGIAFALLNSLIIALYSVVDGIGVRASGNAAAYTLWLFFLDSWGILGIALYYRGGAVLSHLRKRWRQALAGSVMTVGSYGIVLWAMSIASIAAVAALRETSVIFAACLGTWLLRERMGSIRAVGAIFIALGAIAIRFSG
jgi:drug/metabolite transporter (DMT)-like permease